MQAYIDQLLEDIRNAQREESPAEENIPSRAKSFEDDFEEIERWMEHEPSQTFSYYCGLEKVQFPPAERLTIKQMRQINKAFEYLLFTWNLGADIPKKIPVARRYTFLVSVLDEKTDIVSSGQMIFDFCTCDPGSCPFEEHCACKDFEFDKHDKKKDSPTPL